MFMRLTNLGVVAVLFIFAESAAVPPAGPTRASTKGNLATESSKEAENTTGPTFFKLALDIDESVLHTTQGSISLESLVTRINHDLARRLYGNTQPLSSLVHRSDALDHVLKRDPSSVSVGLTKSGVSTVPLGSAIFHATVHIGTTNPQPVTMVMSTRFHDSWVAGPNVVYGNDQTPSQSARPHYDPKLSSTKATSNIPCVYEDGLVRGHFFTDDLLLGNGKTTVHASIIGLCVAENLNGFFSSSTFRAAGVLGLAPPTDYESGWGINFLQRLVEGHAVMEPVLAFRLVWGQGQSELWIGRTERARTSQPFPLVVHPMSSGPPTWAVQLTDVFFDDTSRYRLGTHIYRGDHLAFFDSGSTFIELPLYITDVIFTKDNIPGFSRHESQALDYSNVHYTVPCDTLAHFHLKLAGVKVPCLLSALHIKVLDQHSDRCLSGIMGVPQTDHAILGQRFMSMYYTAFKFPAEGMLTIELSTWLDSRGDDRLPDARQTTIL